MMTIQKKRIADCDRGTDDNGNFVDDGYQFVVCEDNDVTQDYETFDTIAEAEQYILEAE